MERARALELVATHTRITAPPLCPEVRLHLVTPDDRLWHAGVAELAALEIAHPYWAFCWAGGQALARHVLDHPALVAGRRVLDVGTGCGVAGIAAALGGASRVDAVDLDGVALAAAQLNAALNNVTLHLLEEDVTAMAGGSWDVILAADVCYDRDAGNALMAWLRDQSRQGVLVLLADPRRGHVPLDGLLELACMDVPVHPALEDGDVKRTWVLQVRA